MIKEFPKIDMNKLDDPIDDPEFDAMVRDAVEKAMSKAEYDRITAESDALTATYLNAEISQAEYETRVKQYSFRPIQVETLVEYRHLLSLVLGNDNPGIQETITHENSHMNKLQSLGLEGTYALTIVRDEAGKIGIFPRVRAIFPDGMPEDERRRLTREITEAPDDLSASDKIHLGLKD